MVEDISLALILTFGIGLISFVWWFIFTFFPLWVGITTICLFLLFLVALRLKKP